MSNEYFKFKQFTVHHDRCAMKVGTDGVLLGAWASGGDNVLDIGTGTGLIAMMMAQRFPSSCIDGIEIDGSAAAQAADNVLLSPFAERIKIFHNSLREFHEQCGITGRQYDCIVSNPPFYTEDTACPEQKRDAARHTSSLSYNELFRSVAKLLSNDGTFSIIVPYDAQNKVLLEAAVSGLYVHKTCNVRTTPRKSPKRTLMQFGNVRRGDTETVEGCLMNADGSKSEWYKNITGEFYL